MNALDSTMVLRTLRTALTGRIPIPLSLLRAQAAKLSSKVDLELEAESPGLRVRGRAEALGAPIAFSVRIDVGGLEVQGERRTVRIRLSDVELSTRDDAPGPLAEAIRSGMIDTANPATLIGNMTSLPPFIIESEGDLIVVDLMQIPRLADDPRLQGLAAAVTSLLGVRDVVVEDEAIGVGLGVLLGGPKEAAMSAARLALLPAVQSLWPGRSWRP